MTRCQQHLFADPLQEREDAARAEFLEVLHALDDVRLGARSLVKVDVVVVGQHGITIKGRINGGDFAVVNRVDVECAARDAFTQAHGDPQ